VVDHRTVVVLETVAIAKFTPLDEMRKSGEYDDIEALTMQLVNMSKTSRKIEVNVTHEDDTEDI
jgi:hypothetical protein